MTTIEYSEFFTEKVKKLLEEFPVVNPDHCSTCPDLPDRVDRIRQAFTVIQKELSEIECMQSSNDEETDPQGHALIPPVGSFLDSFNQFMSCRP
ncbi:MAG TPA: hypothetical protein V6D16_04015 [Candidatus Obscuribacterales bacterium]